MGYSISANIFPVEFQHAATNLADATNYYFADFPALAATSLTTAREFQLMRDCVLIAVNIESIVAGTLASNEASTLAIRSNNTTDNVLSTAITYTAAFQQIAVTGLSVFYAANTKIQAKLTSATFATNPTNVYTALTLWFAAV